MKTNKNIMNTNKVYITEKGSNERATEAFNNNMK